MTDEPPPRIEPAMSEDQEPQEYLAAVYLLRMGHLNQSVVSEFIHEEGRRWIDFQGLLDALGWSHTEEIVLRAAQSLWSGKRECGIGEACSNALADRHFRTILEAMAMRRGMQISFLPTADEPDTEA